MANPTLADLMDRVLALNPTKWHISIWPDTLKEGWVRCNLDVHTFSRYHGEQGYKKTTEAAFLSAIEQVEKSIKKKGR